MKNIAKEEIEKLRKELEADKGEDLLKKYHDAFLQVLEVNQKKKVEESPDIVLNYVSLQQEILRRLNLH